MDGLLQTNWVHCFNDIKIELSGIGSIITYLESQVYKAGANMMWDNVMSKADFESDEEI